MSIAIDRALTETQRQVVGVAREFARTHIAPHAPSWERARALPPEILAELGQLGFFGLTTAEDYDGLGLDTVTYALVLEELAAADASVAVTLNIHNAIVATLLGRHGTPSQKDRWLRPMARGELLAGFALSEPEAGSDAGALRARALADGDAWVLSGTKAWVTHGARADLLIVLARSEPGALTEERGPQGISAFLVPTATAGYRPGPAAETMGLNALAAVTVELEAVRLPAEYLVGAAGAGFRYAMEALDVGRIGTAAQAVGLGRRALEHAVAYCGERRQFDRALRAFEGVQFKLADMATRVEAARALTLEAAARRDQGGDFTALASMAKLFASETAMWVATQAIQLFGGYGYMRDFPVERLFRDAKATEIYEGTSEIQRLIIARALYGPS